MSRHSSLRQWIDEFLQSQQIDKNAAKHTIQSYRSDLTHWCESHEKDHARDVTQKDLDQYFLGLTKKGLSPRSIARKITVLKQFFKFSCIEKGLSDNPAQNLQFPILPKDLPKALSLGEIQDLLDVARAGVSYRNSKLKTTLQSRDRAMIFLLYATGVRISELVQLELDQIDLENEILKTRGKGDKERIAPFTQEATTYLIEYLQNHRPTLSQDSNAVFLNHLGSPLTRQSAWKLVKKIASTAGLPPSVSPHTLRHSFATHLLQSGLNLRSLQLLLGHSDLSTTQIYTEMSPEHLKKAHKKYHPRGE